MWYEVETIDRITESRVAISLKQKLFNIEKFYIWCNAWADEYVANVKAVVKQEKHRAWAQINHRYSDWPEILSVCLLLLFFTDNYDHNISQAFFFFFFLTEY